MDVTFLLILSSLALIKENKGCNRVLDFVSNAVRNEESESSLLTEANNFVVSSETDF